MKPFTFIISLIVVLSSGCFAPRNADTNTVLKVNGTAGSKFVGYYVENGRRTTVSGTIPESFQILNLTRCEFKKVTLTDTMFLEMSDGHSYMKAPAPPGVAGIKANTKGGWSFESLYE